MSSTIQLGLPLVQSAQAQKHVTINEAFSRLDGLVELTLVSKSRAIPPAVVTDGVCFGVPVGAVNEWSGQAGRIAIGANGGWEFADPWRGWRAMILDEGALALFDGAVWRTGMVTLSPHNAGISFQVTELDHSITAGAISTTSAVIPSHAMVFGVTARVTQAISGTLTSWTLGNPGAAGRFGTDISLSVGSWARGMLAQPMTCYSPEVLQLEAVGGDFSGGVVRMAVHFLEIALPDQ